MFNGKKRTYSREALITTTNAYNERLESYSLVGDILMFISILTNEMTSSNDVRVIQCSHIGLTQEEIEVGDRIDGKYIVEFINSVGIEKICFLKEIDSNGKF